MNWAMVIILGVGLPLIGSIIGVLMLYKKYTWLKTNSSMLDMDEREFRRMNFGKYVVFQNLFATGPIYGFLVIILLWNHSTDVKIPDDTFSLFGMTLALAIGAPGAFGNISRGLISQKALEAIVKEPETLGRGIVHTTIPELPMMFGLLFAILSLAFSGLFIGEFWLSFQMVESMFFAIVVFAILSSGIILSGFSLKRANDPFSMKGFREGVILNTIGVIPSVVGLVYVILKFVEIDLFLAGPPP